MSDRRTVTAAFVSLAAATGLPVGDHTAPVEVAGKPWAIVYSISGGGLLDSNLAALEEGMDLIYQVTSVGRRRDQAEWLADRTRGVVVGRTAAGFSAPFPAIAGAKVADRQLWGGLGGVEPSGDSPNQVWSVAERFLLRLVRV